MRCPGGGKKKDCKEAGGEFVHISDHMKDLWMSINFVPTGFELPTHDTVNDATLQDEELSQPNSNVSSDFA